VLIGARWTTPAGTRRRAITFGGLLFASALTFSAIFDYATPCVPRSPTEG